MRKMYGIVSLLVVGACTGPTYYPMKPDQREAMQLVWVETFGQPIETLPDIDWVEGIKLDCDNGRRFIDRSICQGGNYQFFEGRNGLVRAAWPAGTTKISETFVVHELYHALLLQKPPGFYDVYHKDPGFAPGGAVDMTVLALKMAGY
jgi:hypothetical protein